MTDHTDPFAWTHPKVFEGRGYQRVNFFHGNRLEAVDFQIEQAYHRYKHKLHNRFLHGPGIVPGFRDGLQVKACDEPTRLIVLPGYAIDDEGNDLILWEKKILDIDLRAAPTVHIVLRFVQDPINFVVKNPKFPGHRHVRETVRIDRDPAPPGPNDGVELARIAIAHDTTSITDAASPQDPRPGEIDLRHVRLSGGTPAATVLELRRQVDALQERLAAVERRVLR